MFEKQDLFLSYQKGEKWALEEVYKAYKNKIYGYIYHRVFNKDLVDDIFQEVWVKLIRHHSTYDPSKEFYYWMWKVVQNTLYTHIRRVDVSEQLPENLYSDENIEDDFINKVQMEQLQSAIEKIDEAQREVLLLWLNEISYEQISELTSRSIDSVKGLLKRAKKKLELLIKEQS